MLTVILWYLTSIVYLVVIVALKKRIKMPMIPSKALDWSMTIFGVSVIGMYVMFYLGIALLVLMIFLFFLDRLSSLILHRNLTFWKGITVKQFILAWFLTVGFLIVHYSIFLVFLYGAVFSIPILHR